MEARRRFAIALSFAGEQRTKTVEPVAQALARQFTRDRVLYDHFHKEEFARPNLNVHLPNLYRSESELVVVVLSPDYPKKKWCGLELRFIRELIENQPNRVMLLAMGDPGDQSHLGILPGDGYLSVYDMTPKEVTASIVKRYRQETGMPEETKTKTTNTRATKPRTPKTTYAPGSRESNVLKWLQAQAAKPFLKAQIADIQAKFPGANPRNAEGVVKFFAEGEPGDAQRSFYSVLRAAKAALDAVPDADKAQVHKAIIGLYLLVAVKIVNKAALVIVQNTEVRRVPDGDINLCAIVATELFGGDLQFRLNCRSQRWEPEYVFRIHAPVAGDNMHRAFAREVYRRVIGKESEDEVLASRNDSELTKAEKDALITALGGLRHIDEYTLALVDAGNKLGETIATEFASEYEVPILLPDSGLKNGFVGMTQGRLLAELNQLWIRLYGPTTVTPPPDKAPPEITTLVAQLAAAAKNHPSPEIAAAIAVLQAESKPGATPDRDQLTRVADAAKKLAAPAKEIADGMESGKKIVGLAAALYNKVAPFLGLPPLF